MELTSPGLQKADLVLRIVLVGMAAALLFHGIQGYVRGLGYPYDTFLFQPGDRFNDFFNVIRPAAHLDPYPSSVSVYLPFSYLVAHLFNFMPEHVALFVFEGLFLAVAGGWLYAAMPLSPPGARLAAAAVLTLGAYPVVFCLDRANFEGLLFCLLAVFTWSYYRRWIPLSVAALAVAITFKAYPGVFIVLMLADRRYKAALATLLTAGALTLAGFLALHGGFTYNFAGLLRNLAHFKDTYIIDPAGMGFSASLLGVIRIALEAVFAGAAPDRYVAFLHGPEYARLLIGYFLACLAAFGALAAFIVRREPVYWRRLTILVITVLVLPQVSFDYKLVHLLIPLAFFFRGPEAFDAVRRYAWTFGLLLVPKAYHLFFRDVSTDSVLNTGLLLAFLVVLIAERLDPRAAPAQVPTPAMAAAEMATR